MTTDYDPKPLNDLIDKAEREGMWLFSQYAQEWFSPAELRQHNANGRFRWGPCNWKLRDPAERLKEIEQSIQNKKQEHTSFRERMSK